MTLSAKVGTLNTPTSTGNQTVSGLGFTPVAIILWGVLNTGTGFAAANEYGMGFSAYNAAKSAYQQGAVAFASSSGDWTYGTDYANIYQDSTSFVIRSAGIPGSVVLEGTITSMASGQFVINWTTVQGTSYPINFLALGGSDIANAGVMLNQLSTSSGNQSFTGLGFKPSCAMHIGIGWYNAPPSGTYSPPYDLIQLGAMTSTAQFAIDGLRPKGDFPTATWSEQLTNKVLLSEIGVNEAEYVSFDNDGFTLNLDYAFQYGHYFFSLCLAGVKSQVGAWSKSTGANGSTDTVATPGITPVAVIAATDSKVAAATQQPGFRFSFGAGDGTNNGVAGGTSENNVSTTVDYKFSYTNEAIVVNDSDASTPDALGTIGLANDAFVVTWGTNNAVATQICYIVFGLASVNAGSATATVLPSGNVPSIGVVTSSVNGTVNPSANVPQPGVSLSTIAAVVSPSAKVPLVGVKPPDVTGQVAPVLNVPLVGVGPPTVVGAALSLAFVPLINVSATPLTAIVNPLANVPLPGVRLVPASSAVISPVANVDEVNVGPQNVTGLIEPLAYIPLIDVSLPGITAIVDVRAIVPWVGVSVYRHHRAPSQILAGVPRCPGLFDPAGARCEGLLVSRGSRNVGFLEPDMTKDDFPAGEEN
jgi:hypothetical protein